MDRLKHGFFSRSGVAVARSFFPLFAVLIIAGAMLWGPWISLTVTVIAIAAALRLL